MTEQNKRMHKEAGEALAEKMHILELCSQLRHSAKSIRRLNIPEYNWWNESLHGVARAGTATVFPQAIAMAAAFDPEMVHHIAEIISNEARAKYNYSQSIGDRGIYKGLTMWSPNINIFRDPRWGRGHETYGEDPYLTGELGVAFIRGLQGDDEKYLKTSACAKHFAVHSGPEPERHTFNAVVSKKDMFETYLPAFRRAVQDAHVSGVMGAYNRTNGEPCCASPTLMGKLLRGAWGFDGYYVSDCGALMDIVFRHRYAKNPLKGAALALNCGCELECGTLYSLLPACHALRLVKASTLRKSVARLMAVRSALGMFDKDCPFHKISPAENATPENEAASAAAAEKCIVLLENNGILPLSPNAQRILVTGYNAENELAYLGNYNGTPREFCMVPQAVRACNADTVFAPGIHLYDPAKCDGRRQALELAKTADVILLCTGLDASIEGEESGGMLSGGGGRIGRQGDRETLELPQVQQDFIEDCLALGKKLILLNFSGGCIDFRAYKGRADAILQCWYPGAQGGKAIADLLFGKASPSGKLPVTFYNDIAEIPDFEDYRMENRTYRYFKGKPQYPFGYGLSYTHFALSRLTLSEGRLSCTVTNTGDFDSDTVLQLYTAYPKTPYQNPRQALIKFRRLHLAKGEQKTVEFMLSEKDFYSVNEAGDTVLLQGEYPLTVSNGQDILDSSTVFQNTNPTKTIEKCPI